MTTILPQNPPGPARSGPNVDPKYVVIALVVIAALVGGYLAFGRGGGSSSAATPPPVVPTESASVPPAPSAVPPTGIAPSRLVSTAKRSLKRIKWGHSYVQITGSNGNTETEDVRGGPHVQTETDTFDGHVAKVITLHKVAFVQADAFYLQNLDRFPAAEAQLAAGQWVKVRPGDRPYRKVTQNDRGSNSGIPFHGPFSVVGAVERQGVSTIEIQGVTGKKPHERKATMFVDARRHVPVEYDESGVVNGVRITVAAVLSDFGRRVAIHAPRGAVSYSGLVTEAG